MGQVIRRKDKGMADEGESRAKTELRGKLEFGGRGRASERDTDDKGRTR